MNCFLKWHCGLGSNSLVLQAEAAKAGAGIAMVAHFIARTHAALAPCLTGYKPPARELCLITRRQDTRDIAIKVVVDFLQQLFAAERALFES